MRSPRLLACIVVGQILGILCAELLSQRLPVTLLCVLFGGGGASLAAMRLPFSFRAALVAGTIAAGLLVGQLECAAQDRLRLPAAPRTFDACVESIEFRSSGARYVWGRIRAADDRPRLPIRAEWFPSPPSGPPTLHVGDCFRLRARFRAIRSFANPGGIDRARAKERRGLVARITLVGERWITVTRRAPETPRWHLNALRERVAARMRVEGRAGGLVAALSLGDRRGLASQDRDRFARLGVAHVLAVSGLHLVLVAGLVFSLARVFLGTLGRWTTRVDSRSLSVLAATLAATLYALLSGPGVAALRAWVVVVAVAGGFALGRPDALRAGFWLAAAALLAFDPASLFDLGAQLSFGATAALLYASPVSEDSTADSNVSSRYARSMGGLQDALRASATAIAVTTPMLAAGALEVTPFGLVSNLVAIPWMAFALLPASLLAAFGLAVLPAEAHPVAGLVDLAVGLARLTLYIAATCDALLPPSAAAVRPAFFTVALSAFVALLSIRARPTVARVVLCLVAVGIVRAPLPSWPSSGPERPSLVAFDVGSGDAILLRAGTAAMLVDGGLAMPPGPQAASGYDLGEREVLPALRALGVSELAVVVATHADSDHVGGLPAVLRGLPVGEVWLPRGRAADSGFDRLLTAAFERGVRVREVGQGTRTTWIDPDLKVDVLWPPDSGGDKKGRNDASVVLRVRLGKAQVLLAGDLGKKAEQRLLASGVEVAADILKVGHHGSATSSSSAWLEAIGPSVAIVSAGCNRQGLPAPETLARLGRVGAARWWTGEHGAVTVSVDRSAHLHVTARRLQWPRSSRVERCRLR